MKNSFIVLMTLFLSLLTLGSPAVSGTVTTAGSGNWSSTTPNAPWSGGTLPLATDDVVIADGSTVIIDQNITVASLTIGQGASGLLSIDGTTARALVVSGDITIGVGGSFLVYASLTPTGDLTSGSTTIANVSSTVGVANGMNISGVGIPAAATVASFTANSIVLSAAATATGTGVALSIKPTVTQTISIGGNIVNNGTFDLSLNSSTTVCNATFTKAGDQTITGTGTLTRFRGITLNKSAVGNRVVCSVDASKAGSGVFIFTAGTWEQTAGTLTFGSGNETIAATGSLKITGSANFSDPGASLTVTGNLTVNTSGTFVQGSGNNSITMGSTTSSSTWTSGTVTLNGRLDFTDGVNVINGANITIHQQATNSASAGNNGFNVGVPTGTNSFTFSSGAVTLGAPNATADGSRTGRDIKIAGLGTGGSLVGSTFYLGDGNSTPVSAGTGYWISVTSPVALNNLVLQSGGVTGRNSILNANLIVNGTLSMKGGTLNLNAKTLTLGASSTLTYNGPSAQVTGSELLSTLNNLTINNSAGVTLNSPTTVNGVLTLAAGNLDNSVNQVTLGPSGSVVNTGGSISQAPLPVEMTSFTVVAHNSTVSLSWTTATEVSNYGFDVERTPAGKQSWSKVSFVAGNGTSNVAHNYSYEENVTIGKYSYRLKQIDRDGKFQYSKTVEATVGLTPNTMILGQNYPNPFNPETKIEFAVPATGFTTLKVYNMLGAEVSTLVNGNVEAGVLNQVSFKGANFPSGMYFYTLRSGSFVDTKKMLMVK